MALADCIVPSTGETIDPALVVSSVAVTSGTISTNSQTLAALMATWTDPGSTYITGLQFKFVPHDGTFAPVTTAAQPIANGSWTCTNGILAGKNYDVSHRAVGQGANVFGSWVSDGSILLPTTSVAGGLAQNGSVLVDGVTIQPVSVQPFVLALRDGDVVAFSPAYSAAPYVAFSSVGLKALTTGQNYYFLADGLSGSGFTARIKIRTPASPTYTTQTDGPTTTQTAPDDWEMDKSLTNDAYNGIYTFRVKGTYKIKKTLQGVDPPDYQSGVGLAFWVRPNGTGSWIAVGSYTVSGTGITGVYSFDITASFSVGVALSNGAGTEFKVTVASRTFTSTDDKITEFTSVAYTYQSGGGAPTDVSATPNGETCITTISPLNT